MAADVIRVAIIDDHPVVREGTAGILRDEPDLEIVAATADLARLAAHRSLDTIDVIVLDVRLEEASGLELLQQELAGAAPAVVLFTGFDYPQYAQAARRLGAAGFVSKDESIEDLLAAIRVAASGGTHFPLIALSDEQHLTPREREVLALVAAGRSNDEVAGSLGISPRTVETYLDRMYQRFDVASRTELVARALQEGWLDIPDEGSRQHP